MKRRPFHIYTVPFSTAYAGGVLTGNVCTSVVAGAATATVDGNAAMRITARSVAIHPPGLQRDGFARSPRSHILSSMRGLLRSVSVRENGRVGERPRKGKDVRCELEVV